MLPIPSLVLPTRPDQNIYDLNTHLGNWEVTEIDVDEHGYRKEHSVKVFPGGEDKPKIVHFVILMGWFRSPIITELNHIRRRSQAGVMCGLLPSTKDESLCPDRFRPDYEMVESGEENSAAVYFNRFLLFQKDYAHSAVLEYQLTLANMNRMLREVNPLTFEKGGASIVKAMELCAMQTKEMAMLHAELFGMKVVADELLARWQQSFTYNDEEAPEVPEAESRPKPKSRSFGV